MDYSEAAERISRKFSKSGQAVDVKKIEGKLRRLVDEFGVQPQEAERSVTNELNKEFNIPAAGSGGGGKAGSANEQKKIAEGSTRGLGHHRRKSGRTLGTCLAIHCPERDHCRRIRRDPVRGMGKIQCPRHGRRVVVPHRVRGSGRVQGYPQPEDPLGNNGEGDQR